MSQRIEISHKTIIFTVLLLISLWVLYAVRDVIFILMLSFVLMSGLRPFVDALEKIKIPRALSILLVYIALIGFISLVFFIVIPPLVIQFQNLLKIIQSYISYSLPFLDITPESITGQIPFLSQNVLKITSGIFSTLFGLFSFFVFTFYFLLERQNLKHFLINFVGREAEEKIADIILQVEKRLESWVIGQMTLALIIGLATYIGLKLLGLEFALPLAIIAGTLEIIPIIGPVVSAIPAFLVALNTSPILALAVVVLFIVIQQIENNLVVPLVMRQAVGLPPLVTIIALMIGGKLAGIGGIILSVPLVVAGQIIIRQLLVHYKNEK